MASGAPVADATVELWVQGQISSGTISASRRESADHARRVTPAGSSGAENRTAGYVPNSAYAALRLDVPCVDPHDGFVPVVSDWVTLDGERATIPPIRLQPLQKLARQINDRQDARLPAPGSSSRLVVPLRRPMPKGALRYPI